MVRSVHGVLEKPCVGYKHVTPVQNQNQQDRGRVRERTNRNTRKTTQRDIHAGVPGKHAALSYSSSSTQNKHHRGVLPPSEKKIQRHAYTTVVSSTAHLRYLEGSGVGSGGGHDDAVAHGILLAEQTHQLGDRGPLLPDAHVTAVPQGRKQRRDREVEVDGTEERVRGLHKA